MIGGEIIPQKTEVSEIKWIKYDKVIDVITYENKKELFKKVLKDLENAYLKI